MNHKKQYSAFKAEQMPFLKWLERLQYAMAVIFIIFMIFGLWLPMIAIIGAMTMNAVACVWLEHELKKEFDSEFGEL